MPRVSSYVHRRIAFPRAPDGSIDCMHAGAYIDAAYPPSDTHRDNLGSVLTGLARGCESSGRSTVPEL